MRIAVVVNPASRAGSRKRLLPDLERSFGSQLVEVRQPSGPEEATALTRELVGSGVDTVVAVGGDGTVNAVVNGMVGSLCRLGIIPAGTANDLAASVGLPMHVAEACAVIKRGSVRSIDVIRANAWYFITSGGAGLPPEVLETVDHLRRRGGPGGLCARLLGSGLYPISMLYHLLRGLGPARAVRLELDGHSLNLRVHALLVANLSRIGRHMRIAPGADASDGRLHVFALEAGGSRLGVALSALGTLNGSGGRDPRVRMFSGRTLTCLMDAATPFCADGETRLCSSAFKFDLLPGAIHLHCPR